MEITNSIITVGYTLLNASTDTVSGVLSIIISVIMILYWLIIIGVKVWQIVKDGEITSEELEELKEVVETAKDNIENAVNSLNSDNEKE